jgi:hypothetical protein
MSPLSTAATRFAELYNRSGRLASEQGDWTCTVRLVATDAPEAARVCVARGRAQADADADPGSLADVEVRAPLATLLDVLELRRGPNEPYLFGELTVSGPEEHFLRLDYVTAVLCPA